MTAWNKLPLELKRLIFKELEAASETGSYLQYFHVCQEWFNELAPMVGNRNGLFTAKVDKWRCGVMDIARLNFYAKGLQKLEICGGVDSFLLKLNCPSLEKLDMRVEKSVSDNSINELVTAAQHLCKSNPQFHVETWRAVFDAFSQHTFAFRELITSVLLHDLGTVNILDASELEKLNRFPNLRDIELRNINTPLMMLERIPDLSSCVNVRSLVFGFSLDVPDPRQFAIMLNGFKHLEKLDMEINDNIIQVFKELANHARFPRLKSFQVGTFSQEGNLNDSPLEFLDAVAEFGREHPSIVHLWLFEFDLLLDMGPQEGNHYWEAFQTAMSNYPNVTDLQLDFHFSRKWESLSSENCFKAVGLAMPNLRSFVPMFGSSLGETEEDDYYFRHAVESNQVLFPSLEDVGYKCFGFWEDPDRCFAEWADYHFPSLPDRNSVIKCHHCGRFTVEELLR